MQKEYQEARTADSAPREASLEAMRQGIKATLLGREVSELPFSTPAARTRDQVAAGLQPRGIESAEFSVEDTLPKILQLVQLINELSDEEAEAFETLMAQNIDEREYVRMLLRGQGVKKPIKDPETGRLFHLPLSPESAIKIASIITLIISMFALNPGFAKSQSAVTETPTPISSEAPKFPTATPEPSNASAPYDDETTQQTSPDFEMVTVSKEVLTYRLTKNTIPLESPSATAKPSEGAPTLNAGSLVESATKFGEYVAIKVVVGDEAKYAWIALENLTAIEATPTPEFKTVVKARVLVDGLNVRSGAGTNFDVVGSMNAGDEAEIVGEINGWYELSDGRFISAAAQFTQKVETQDPVAATGNEVLEQFGEGGQISPEQLYEGALRVVPEAVNIVIDPIEGPAAVDAAGNVVAKYVEGRWKTMEQINAKRYTAAELLAAFPEDEMIQKAVQNVSKEQWVENSATGKAEAVPVAEDNYEFWMEGEVLHAQLTIGEKVIYARWMQLDHHACWIVDSKLKGETYVVSPALSYNEIHPNRMVLVNDGKRPVKYLLDLEGNSIEGINKSVRKQEYNLNPTQDLINQAIDLGYLPQGATPEDNPDLTGEVLIDDLNKAAFDLLKTSELVTVDEDGKIYTINGSREKLVIDSTKEIVVDMLRTPEVQGQVATGEWYLGKTKVLDIPSHPFQVTPDGQLVITITLKNSTGSGIAPAIMSAWAMLLRDVAKVQPDTTMSEFYDWPVYDALRNSLMRYITDGENTYLLRPELTTSASVDGTIFTE